VKQSGRNQYNHNPLLSPNPYQSIAVNSEEKIDEAGKDGVRARGAEEIKGGVQVTSAMVRTTRDTKTFNEAVQHGTVMASARLRGTETEHDASELLVVSGKFDGKECNDVLVDGGASSNFVRRDWMISQGIASKKMERPLEVTLADGRVAGQQADVVVIEQATANGSSASCRLIVMEQLSHEIIIGLPWLKAAKVVLG